MGKLKGFQDTRKINTIILHCTATPNGRVTTNEDIDGWHRQKGFKRNKKIAPFDDPTLKSIGYHYVIYINGCVRTGRSHKEMGAHAYGHNRNSLAIALVGNGKFTKEQWQSLKSLVRSLQSQHRGSTVIGHNALDQLKTCPGFSVDEWLNGDMKALDKHILI